MVASSATPPFRYAERRPAPALQPWLRNYWMLEVGPGAPPMHHVPPDGCTALVIRLAGYGAGSTLLSGPWLEPLMVPVFAGDVFGGIRLHPGALGPALGLDPGSMRNRVRPVTGPLATLGAVIVSAGGSSGPAALGQIFDAHLPALFAGRPARDPIVAGAVDRLIATGGELSIAGLAAEFAVSDRTLRRRFGRAAGLSPKEFARIRRLLAAAWAMSEGAPTWSAAAQTAGYADQPHLHRDLTDFTGLTPRAFGARIKSTEHDDVAP